MNTSRTTMKIAFSSSLPKHHANKAIKSQAIVEDEALCSPLTQGTLSTVHMEEMSEHEGAERLSISSSQPSFRTCTQSNISQDFSERVDQELSPLQIPGAGRRKKDSSKSKLRPLPDIYGRDTESQLLQETFYLTVERSCRALLNITGDSGSGKSSLAATLKTTVTEFGGIFVTSKFDLQCNVPCSGLMQAFSNVVNYLVSNQDLGEIKRIIEALREAIGMQQDALRSVVPNIHKLFPDENDEKAAYKSSVGVDGRQAALHYAVRAFIRAVTSDDHPLVMVINDVQNADSSSLGIIDALLADQQGGSLLFVTTARDEGPHLEAWNQKLEQIVRADVLLQLIHLGPLTPQAVSDMTAASLDLNHPTGEQQQELQKLAIMVHKKTHGNAFFVLQFLQSLADQKLMQYVSGHGWYWDLDKIQQENSTVNVADLMKERLYHRLDDDGRSCISVAAHLGQSFTTDLLEVVVFESYQDRGNREFLDQDLSQCVNAGLLEYDTEEERYTFVHDQVQDAAMKLLGLFGVPIRQAQIGRQLLMHHKVMPSEDCLFVGVDLCLKSIKMTEDVQEREQLVPFLRQAGELAMKKAAFQQALDYYESGLLCLKHKTWDTDHDTFLALTSGAAEAAHCSASHANLETHLASILGREMTLNEKMRAYMMRIKSYGEKERFQEAIVTAVDIYNQMGFGTSLQTNPGKVNVVVELLKTKKVLKRHTQESLISLPEMEDERRIAAMGIIDMLAVPAYSASPMLYVLIWLRAVRWSVKFGVCKYSATAFSRFSAVVGAVLKKPKEAFMYAQVALGLSDRLNARDTLAKTVAGVYGFTLHWTSDLRSSVNPLLYGYQVGMQTGDVEYAFHSLLHYNVASWLTASCDLERYIADLEEHCQLMLRYNQKALYTVASMLLCMSRNFRGGSADPMSFSMNLLDDVETPDSGVFVLAHRTMKLAMMHSCYFFGDYAGALCHANQSADVGVKVAQGYLFVARHRFLHGMISIANARNSFDNRVRFAKTVANTLDKWVDAGKYDCEHYSQLLKAEIAGFQGKFSMAVDFYKASLQTAQRLDFEHDQALVHERMGLFYLKGDNSDRASYHIGQAVIHYRKWGAEAKVKHLIDTHGDLVPASAVNPVARRGESQAASG